MKGLLLKDFYTLSKNSRIYGFLLVFYLAFSILTENIYFSAGACCFMLLYYTITTFSFDEYSKWDSYAMALPITRKQIVLAKYLFAGATVLVGLIMALFSILIFSVFKDVALMETMGFLFCLFVCGVLFLAVQIPFVYRLGLEKARMIPILFFLIPVFGAVVLEKLGIFMLPLGIPMPSKLQAVFLFGLFVVGVAFAVLISYRISVGIFEKKEF